MTLSTLSDQELIEHALEHREDRDQCFRILYRRITPRLRSHLQRRFQLSDATTEDVIQQTWQRIHRHLHRYRGDQAKPSTRIFHAVRNLARNVHRDSDRNPIELAYNIEVEAGRDGEDERALQFSAPDAAPDEEARQRELRQEVEESIEELPEHYRLAIQLRHYEGRSYAEVSSILGVPSGTAKSRIYRARQRLRDRLREKLDADLLPEFFDPGGVKDVA